MIGRTVSHYRIVSQLGVGGMGVVYRAEDVRLGRPVAVKFVSEDLGSDEQAIQRLRAEARAASALNHGNICTIYDIGEDDGKPFIVMELMKGESLRERLARGPLKIHQLVDMGIEIADALNASHTDGIIHRDIKPGNIFLTEGGHVKLLDFGLAKLTPNFTGSKTIGATRESTVAGITLGTISYMSPEQATGDELDGRTDLFSLGVLMYECATGTHPFPGKTSAVTLAGILHKAPIPPLTLNPELPLRLQEVLNNCLEKDRELRYQSAADLRADLKRVRRDMESGNTRTIDVISSRGVAQAADSSPSARTARTTTQNAPPVTAAAPPPVATTAAVTLKWLIAGAVVIAVAAGGFFAIWGNRAAPASAPTATATQTPPQVSSGPDGIVQSRLALANASLQARNYRAAAAYAAEVLGVDATNADAAKIRDEAQTMLARFDAGIAEARRRLSAGDVVAAARALEMARRIDPTAPVIIELSSGLNEALRKADAGARAAAAREVRDARQAAPPPPPPAVVPRPTPDTSAAARADTAAGVGSAPAAVVTSPAVPAPKPVETTSPPPQSKPDALDAPVRTAPVAPSAPVAPVAPSGADDETAIRRLAATYARAIESKDLSLFRSIKPNLTREEERRLQDGFRAVTSQRVNLTIVAIDRRGDEAAVVVRRRDTIDAGGRQQTNETQQTMRVARSNGSWVIVDIR